MLLGEEMPESTECGLLVLLPPCCCGQLLLLPLGGAPPLAEGLRIGAPPLELFWGIAPRWLAVAGAEVALTDCAAPPDDELAAALLYTGDDCCLGEAIWWWELAPPLVLLFPLSCHSLLTLT